MVNINWLAVLLAAIANMVIGALWYSPALFGKQWTKLMKMSDEDVRQVKKKGMQKEYLVMFIAALVMAYVFAHFIVLLGVVSAIELAFWIWLGFIATTSLGSILFEGKSSTLYLINTSYYLVSLIVMGFILTAWH